MGLDRYLWDILSKRSVEFLRFVGLKRTLTVEILEMARNAADDVTLCGGLTVPTSGSTGYAKGCLFCKSDAVTGIPGIYTNIGTNTSCLFVMLGQIETVIKNITNAQIKLLADPAVELVAAPAAGYFLELVSGSIFMDYGTNVLSETADNLQVNYVDKDGVAASQVIECTGYIDQAADMYTSILPKVNVIATPAQIEAVPLVLWNTSGNFGGNAGANTVLQARINYRVWPALT